jgi:two-component system alkaline phosphatase synthesis response regulator PhoP
MRKVFIVEDDADIREIVLYALRSAGFEAQGFEKAVQLWPALEKAALDLVLLDIMLPGEDGLSILKKLRGDTRTRALPVIMLTAKGSEFDKVKGLDLGADDYIAKPFSVLELVARVNALLRRAGPSERAKRLMAQGLTLDAERHLCTADGAPIDLTLKEFELLRFLMENRGIALGRERLLSTVWEATYEGGTRTVDVHVQTLRTKLGAYGAWVRTVRGVGYRFLEGNE